MSRHSKDPRNNDQHTQSHHANSDDHERRISGKVYVSGQVEANFPANLVEEYKAANRQADSREQGRDTREQLRERREGWRFLVEIVTLGFVMFVAILSYKQTRQSIRTADAAAEANRLSKANFWFDERPFIGTRFTGMPHPVPAMLGIPVASFAYKNYGKGPAVRVRIATWIFTGPNQEREMEA